MNHPISSTISFPYFDMAEERDDMYRILLAAITDINLSLPARQKLQEVDADNNGALILLLGAGNIDELRGAINSSRI